MKYEDEFELFGEKLYFKIKLSSYILGHHFSSSRVHKRSVLLKHFVRFIPFPSVHQFIKWPGEFHTALIGDHLNCRWEGGFRFYLQAPGYPLESDFRVPLRRHRICQGDSIKCFYCCQLFRDKEIGKKLISRKKCSVLF